ncbi:coiled-coil domain-containing protein [Enterococcus rivorum]|uniref:hypothetical protein n=1 Tax=Enterococcus rivorum TaxID=762845 RepID=UPI00363E5DF3
MEELEDENAQLKNELRKIKSELKTNLQEKSTLQEEIESLHLTNQSIENELATVQAMPKDYEARLAELKQVKIQYNGLLRENNRYLDELDLSRRKVERYASKIKQFEKELTLKQEEIDKLSEHQVVVTPAETKVVDTSAYEELARVKSELETAKRQLVQKEAESSVQLSKEELGEILIEAKRQAKEIINQANRRAQLVEEETNRKAVVLKQLEKATKEYASYYNRIKNVQEESEHAFNQIINLVKEDSEE